jgi:exopolysaccharide biosynthesis polyprenyl glycosylphosphotransferase
VGSGVLARETARDLTTRCNVIGALAVETAPPAQDLGLDVMGRVEELERLLCARPVDEVYLAADIHRHREALQRAVAVCERLGIPFAVPAHSFRLSRALPREAHGLGDGYVHYNVTVTRPLPDAVKRALDVVLSAVALAVLSPFLLLVALLVKVTSPGPVLFRQVRVGLRGRHFSMLKFRSMVVDAERRLAQLRDLNEQTGPTFKLARDPRITPIGRFLRKFSVDELPQLVNILRGDMSIVGPRPPVPSEVAQYAAWQRRRLSVRPGLTCLWQVQGRNDIGFDEWMLLDLQYVDQCSIGKDLELIGRTVPVVMTGRGAS